MNSAQGAFQPHRSSTDLATFLCQQIQNNFNANLTTIVTFVDFRAAYDLVSRDILIDKLSIMNTPNYILYAIHDFLCQRFISVRCHDKTSSFKQVRRGLPQGAVSSTTLFNCMVNDLCHVLRCIPRVDIVMFADDLAIYVSGDNMDIMEHIMNCALKLLNEWVQQNEMEVNIDKTFYQIFTMRNIERKPQLFFEDVVVKETTCQRYLGIELDQRLTFKFHVNSLIEKAENRMKILKRLTGTKWGASKDTMILTYKSYILPVLTFGHELLICSSTSTIKKLETVQNKALRIIAGGIKSTPINAMQMFTGIKPIRFACEEAALKLYERVQRTPNCLWNNFFTVVNRLPSKTTFVHKVKSLYSKYGIENPSKTRRFTHQKHRQKNLKLFIRAKENIKKRFVEETKLHHQSESEGKLWSNVNPQSVHSIKRKIYVANFRRQTGHDLLYKHLSRIGVVQSPTCKFCNQYDQTSDHILCCNGLERIREELKQKTQNDEELFSDLYWHVRNNQ